MFFLNVPIGIVAFFVAMSTVTESVSEVERKLWTSSGSCWGRRRSSS